MDVLRNSMDIIFCSSLWVDPQANAKKCHGNREPSMEFPIAFPIGGNDLG